jgi:hypothetical protein
MDSADLNDEACRAVRFLERIDPKKLKEAAESLRREAVAGSGDLQVRIMQAIGQGSQSFAIPIEQGVYEPGQIFWRARRIEADAYRIPSNAFATLGGAWEPPPEVRPGAGRLNREGEALLYTCVGAPMASLPEARVSPGSAFALIKYEATRRVIVGEISSRPKSFPISTRRARRGYRALQDFFLDIFRGAGGDPASYVLSEALAKSMFDLPLQDAWLYPSTLSDGLNAAFKASNAHDALRLVGVAMGRRDGDDGISAVAFGVPDGDGFFWELMGSLTQRIAFPEFVQTVPT